MRTIKLSLVIAFLASFAVINEIIAQGISLSFNLTKNDTLANMIADSKKYDIKSLTLSGYVNEANIKFITDINKNGTLRFLNLKDCSFVETYYISDEISRLFQGPAGYYIADNVNKYLSTLEYGSIFNVYSWDYKVTIEYYDIYDNNKVTRYFHIIKGDGRDPDQRTYKEVILDYSEKHPRLTFQDCTFSELAIPNNIESIGGLDCRFRVKSCNEYVLGNQINTIGENAFKDSYIGTITLNSTIDEIKANAFENATGNCLANSQFLKSVEYIGDNAFKNSSLLEDTNGSITLHAKKIGNDAFFHAAIPKSFSLPNIQELGDSAFMATDIVNVDIGNRIKKIGNSTFENCKTLQTFNGGENIETIGDRTFFGCKQLNAFNPSNNLRTIGKEAFGNNSALVSFSIPSTTKLIGYKAFANSGLQDLDLGNYGNFRRDIIDGCDGLEILSASSNNTNLKSANGVLLSKDESMLLAYPCAKEDAMYEINNQVTEIADSAFYGVNKLRALSISESVTIIGKNAFGKSNILDVKLLPAIPPKVTNNQSGLDQSLVRLFVHEKDYSTYYIANYWGDFKNIFILEKTDWMNEIQTISDNENTEIVKCYDLNGREVMSSYHGVSILKMSDGKTKKVFVK